MKQEDNRGEGDMDEGRREAAGRVAGGREGGREGGKEGSDEVTSAFAFSRIPFFLQAPPLSSLPSPFWGEGKEEGGGAFCKKGNSGNRKSGRRAVQFSLRNRFGRGLGVEEGRCCTHDHALAHQGAGKMEPGGKRERGGDRRKAEGGRHGRGKEGTREGRREGGRE